MYFENLGNTVGPIVQSSTTPVLPSATFALTTIAMIPAFVAGDRSGQASANRDKSASNVSDSAPHLQQTLVFPGETPVCSNPVPAT